MEARIPFGGFYESMWSQGIDEEEQYFEELQETHKLSEDELGKVRKWMLRNSNYRPSYTRIAQEYAKDFMESINRELGLKLEMTYNDMVSPREYNFTTDELYVEISPKDVVLLARRVGLPAIRKAAKRMFTSRDGFISFYDADISTWGKLRTWDHNQLYALMTAAVTVAYGDNDSEYGLDWCIYEGMSGNGDFSEAFWLAFDEKDLLLEIGKLLGRRELKEELDGDEQDDGRRFPVAWANTADYVRRYEVMNTNILNSNKLRGDL